MGVYIYIYTPTCTQCTAVLMNKYTCTTLYSITVPGMLSIIQQYYLIVHAMYPVCERLLGPVSIIEHLLERGLN